MRIKSIFWIAVVIGVSAVILEMTLQSKVLVSRYAFPVLFSAFIACVALTTFALLRLRVRELEKVQNSTDKDLRDSEARFERIAKAGRANHLVQLRTLAGSTVWAAVSSQKMTHGNSPVILTAIQDVTDQVGAERALRESEQRLTAQSAALTTLMERQMSDVILEDRVPEILETCGHTIDVQRASMWQFSDDRSAIHCIDLYDAKSRQHSSGQVIRREDFPVYFSAVENARPWPMWSDDRRCLRARRHIGHYYGDDPSRIPRMPGASGRSSGIVALPE